MPARIENLLLSIDLTNQTREKYGRIPLSWRWRHISGTPYSPEILEIVGIDASLPVEDEDYLSVQLELHIQEQEEEIINRLMTIYEEDKDYKEEHAEETQKTTSDDCPVCLCECSELVHKCPHCRRETCAECFQHWINTKAEYITSANDDETEYHINPFSSQEKRKITPCCGKPL
jgi:hypothetical protein